jgi:hypothetical protein
MHKGSQNEFNMESLTNTTQKFHMCKTNYLNVNAQYNIIHLQLPKNLAYFVSR